MFISASWSRRAEARKLADELQEINIPTTSTWVYAAEGPALDMAYNDIRSVRDCDIFVRLADDLSSRATVPSHLATGARMFEQGLAWCLGKDIYVIGGKQMIYDNLPRVLHVKNTEEFKRALCPSETIQ